MEKHFISMKAGCMRVMKRRNKTMYRSAIVDELGYVMFWCDELQGEEQIECILDSHPEWNRRCVEID